MIRRLSVPLNRSSLRGSIIKICSGFTILSGSRPNSMNDYPLHLWKRKYRYETTSWQVTQRSLWFYRAVPSCLTLATFRDSVELILIFALNRIRMRHDGNYQKYSRYVMGRRYRGNHIRYFCVSQKLKCR